MCLVCLQPVSVSDNNPRQQEEACGAGVASAGMEQMCVDSHFLSTCQDNVGTCAYESSEADLKTTGVDCCAELCSSDVSPSVDHVASPGDDCVNDMCPLRDSVCHNMSVNVDT